MIAHGPVDVIVLTAQEPQINGSILAELQKSAAAGTIRVLDGMILIKEADGKQEAINIEDLPADIRASVGYIETGTNGLFDSEDAATLYEGMVPGSIILALAIEHTWAVGLVNAIDASGAELALNYRVPSVVVDEVMTALTAAQ